MRDWLPAAQQAAEPHRSAILAAFVNLWCARAEAQAHLPELQRALNDAEA
jgi:hypothetical protein